MARRCPIAFPSVTYTFSNGTASDASQVNQCFTDIINGISDGTKDISVNAGTFAGNVSISGNTTLGNASSDDVTVTGSLASSIPIKTTNSFDIGSSTLGLRALYFGANSQTVNIKGSSSMSATYTLTLPVSAGTTGQTMITDGSANMSFRYIEKSVSKTSLYTATGDESVILCDASGGAFTVNLPAAASYTGKHFYIVKTDTSLNAVTVDGNASETISGSTTATLNTIGESIKIICDGSNWHILLRHIPAVPTTYTPTITGCGTVSTLSTLYMRKRNVLAVWGQFTAGTPTATSFSISLPGTLTIEASVIPTQTFGGIQVPGFIQAATGSTISPSTTNGPFLPIVSTATSTGVVYCSRQSVAGNFALENANNFISASSGVSFYFEVPITGWNY